MLLEQLRKVGLIAHVTNSCQVQDDSNLYHFCVDASTADTVAWPAEMKLAMIWDRVTQSVRCPKGAVPNQTFVPGPNGTRHVVPAGVTEGQEFVGHGEWAGAGKLLGLLLADKNYYGVSFDRPLL
eukprot:SAG31_NODE_3915_length_3755_cov_1.358862_6_plen_124_part_01